MSSLREEYSREMLILPIILIIIWYLICDVFHLIPSFMFPGPTDVANSFVRLVVSGQLFRDIRDTINKVLIRMLWAQVLRITLGIMTCWFNS